MVGAVLVVGCAPPATLRSDGTAVRADSSGTIWGDEYEGLAVDGAETVRAVPRGFNAEHVDGETRSTRIDAFAHGANVHARWYPSGKVGSVSWHGVGILREIVAGDFAPAIAEGALIGDPRTGGDLRPSSTAKTEGLAIRPSTSTWSSTRGGGVVLGTDAYRVSLGGWEARDDTRAGVASFEKLMHGGTLGVAAGTTQETIAASIFGARETKHAFASGELALSRERVRAVTRLVASNLSAIAIAGAGPAHDEPLVFARKERWGAALERRDGWSWGESRAGVSTLTRRDVVSDMRRRRAFWDGEWRVTRDTRLQLAARVTREQDTRAVNGTLVRRPLEVIADDWRARATLRVPAVLENGWNSENAYRVEWVQNRTGRPGIIASWSWRMRAGALDSRFSASAHALQRGQVSYSTDDAPPGLVEYAPVTGKGASLAASCRLRLRHHAWLGAAWSQRPPAGSRLWITFGLRG
jgi:hypothetical protein